jgi:hypothetical protein
MNTAAGHQPSPEVQVKKRKKTTRTSNLYDSRSTVSSSTILETASHELDPSQQVPVKMICRNAQVPTNKNLCASFQLPRYVCLFVCVHVCFLGFLFSITGSIPIENPCPCRGFYNGSSEKKRKQEKKQTRHKLSDAEYARLRGNMTALEDARVEVGSVGAPLCIFFFNIAPFSQHAFRFVCRQQTPGR